MTRDEFKKLTDKKIVILDGGTGSFLLSKGMPQGVCPEVWVMDNPEPILQLQGAYQEAGSNIVMAPTFGANRIRLKGSGRENDIAQINTSNVKLSREAVKGKCLVAGNVSMTGLIIYPDDDESFDEVVEVYKEQAKILDAAGCDLFAIETMISLEDARTAVRGIKAVSQLPVMVTMTFESNGRTLYGDTPEKVARVLTEEGADALGTNCSTGPKNMKDIIKAMAAATDLPIIAKPNAGLPHQDEQGRITYDLQPEEFADEMMELIDAGARIVGGCCGTTPEHIRKLAAAVNLRKS